MITMATITEDYCPKDIYRLLLEKGFDGEIHTTYDKEGYTQASITLQMAMKWLRKNHQIFIRPNTSFLYPIKWYSEIFCYGDNLKTQQDIKTEYYDSPEEACEAAIKYCLYNLI